MTYIFQHRKLGILIVFVSSLVFNLFSVYLHYKVDFVANAKFTSVASFTWFTSLVLFGLLIFTCFKDKKMHEDKKVAFNNYEKFYIVIILILGISLRLYKINFHGIYLDEWYWLSQASDVLNGIVKSPFGFIGDQPSNMPVYPVALLLALLKNTYLAVRLPGVLYSLFSILLSFYFLKEAFNKKIALIGLTLLSTSIWDIHMTQLGWNNVNLNPFLISGTIFYLYRGLKRESTGDIFIAGIFLGISLNLLYIAVLNIAVAAIYFIYKLITLKKQRASILYLFLVMIVTIFITSSPTLVKINKYRQQSLTRHKNFIGDNLNFSKNQGGIYYYGEQIKLTIKDFDFDENKYKIMGLWGITLEPIVVLFFIIGLVYALKVFYKSESIIILASFGVMFVPVVFLYRTTSVWREYGFLPSIYMLAAIGAYSISKLLAKLPILSSLGRKLLFFVLVVYLLSFGYYFNRYRNNTLLHEDDIYENYCKKTAVYINNNIPENTLILLPNEMCRELISIVLWQKYRYATYDSYEDINRYLKKNPKIAIVKISDSSYSSQFAKLNLLPVFEEKLSNNYSLKSYIIRGENGKIYSVLFQ